MKSVRRSLALYCALAVFAASAAIAAGVFVYVRALLVAEFEAAVADDLSSVANAVKVWTDGDLYIELNPSVLTGFAAGGDRAFAVRDAAGGTLVAQSASLDAVGRTLGAVAEAGEDAVAWGATATPDGVREVVASRIMPAQWGWDIDDPTIEAEPGVRETRVEVTVARDRAPLDRSVGLLRLLTGAIVLVATAAAAGAAWIGAGRALRPLDRLGRQAARIEVPSDAAPFDTIGPAELRPIAQRLNDLLARLFAASQRETRFTADAAHELRTPIAELRTLTDVALAFPGDPERRLGVIRTANELSIRLSALVDALLGITRRDSFTADRSAEPTDVPALLRGLVAARQDIAAERRLDLRLDAPPAHPLTTDAALLTSILGNLIDNAVAHAPPGSTVRMAHSGGSTGFRFDISNPAPELDPADLAHLFEPFWRAAGPRTDRAHAGLGLTLARSFAGILGMDLAAHMTGPETIQFTLSDRGGGTRRA